MASTIIVTCPECDKQLKASADVVGKKLRCKSCGATFVGRATREGGTRQPAGKPADKGAVAKKATKKDTPAAGKGDKPDDDDATPYGVTEEYLGRRCPGCTNPLDDEQVVCLHCGYNTTTREKARTVKIRDTTGGDVFLWLLPGIICAVVLLIVLVGYLLFVFLVKPETFGDVWYDFLGGKMVKIYTGLLSLFIMYKCGRFAVVRLLINNKPPEVEDKSREDDEFEDD